MRYARMLCSYVPVHILRLLYLKKETVYAIYFHNAGRACA